MRIGILGAPIASENLGCVALTYSMLYVLDRLEKENNESFEYVVFDWSRSTEKERLLCKYLNIASDKIKFCPLTLISDPLRNAKNISGIVYMKQQLKRCDCVIDLTEGDSFSDIYGSHMFCGRTNIKCLIEKLDIPLMLGPQTYGPYISKKSQKLASRAISDADIVMVRDRMSQNVVKSLTGKEAIYTTDLAFLLPYKVVTVENKNCIRVGINASSLLGTDFHEVHEKNFKLNTDYLQYTKRVIRHLLKIGQYEIHMIPHVKKDHELHQLLKKEFPDIILEGPFDDPITIKNLISTMDVFVGARMHGTIAAFTSGVACIPTAYSKKFAGLYESVGYDYIIDLQILSTDEAVDLTIAYVKKYEDLKIIAAGCKSTYRYYVALIYETVDGWLKKIKGQF